jgi:hypothetical protein
MAIPYRESTTVYSIDLYLPSRSGGHMVHKQIEDVPYCGKIKINANIRSRRMRLAGNIARMGTKMS